MKLKPAQILLALFAMLIFSLSACKDFIEPNISRRLVSLKAPSDKYQSTNYNINFWWDEVEDALSYRLQVVTPGFDTIGGLVADTLVKGNRFTLTLDPGEYQWRVRAENGSSQTEFSTPNHLTVIPSSLTAQTVILSSPANNTATNQSSVTFKWASLFSAVNYHIQADTNNFADASHILIDLTIPGQQYTYKFPKDQTYQWRVRAENATEQSKWSVVNNISFDATAPAGVTLSAPQNNAVVNKPVSLQWTKSATASNYKLYVYKADSTTLYSTAFPALLNTNTYSFTLGSSGERIYWRITALDAAGNESAPSALQSFVLQ
ncbi:hypothetical protein [Mucilaginibacter sp. NFR10]|uniref:hypothetical protein n=1 Tax=Mucilaginibacter sp. NFR10 TaxID=1566292 RepID=UPI0008717187|nr:hypothetical protein [Mucilaginibacter sp. NFR10]SCW74493.1 hypothetical protein SAMN03159284_03711 [Mucilaginibacter sp. NFR10]